LPGSACGHGGDHAAAEEPWQAEGWQLEWRSKEPYLKAWFPDPPCWPQKEEGVPVAVGLRVRNRQTWRSGVVLQTDDEEPTCFSMRFDDGEECLRSISRFETEDGDALLAARPTEPVLLTVGLRVQNRWNARCGYVADTNSDMPGWFTVNFDQGKGGLREVANFMSADGGQPLVEAQPVAAGLRVWNPATARTGVVSHEGTSTPGYFCVRFDDGSQGTREVAKFRTLDGRPLAEAARPSASAWEKWSGGGANRGRGTRSGEARARSSQAKGWKSRWPAEQEGSGEHAAGNPGEGGIGTSEDPWAAWNSGARACAKDGVDEPEPEDLQALPGRRWRGQAAAGAVAGAQAPAAGAAGSKEPAPASLVVEGKAATYTIFMAEGDGPGVRQTKVLLSPPRVVPGIAGEAAQGPPGGGAGEAASPGAG